MCFDKAPYILIGSYFKDKTSKCIFFPTITKLKIIIILQPKYHWQYKNFIFCILELYSNSYKERIV